MAVTGFRRCDSFSSQAVDDGGNVDTKSRQILRCRRNVPRGTFLVLPADCSKFAGYVWIVLRGTIAWIAARETRWRLLENVPRRTFSGEWGIIEPELRYLWVEWGF